MNSRELRNAENSSVNEKCHKIPYMYASNRFYNSEPNGKTFFFLIEHKNNQGIVFLKAILVLLNRKNYFIDVFW